MAKANPFDVEKYLQSTNFPASKNDLVSFARNQHAPQDILSALEGIPDRQYRDPSEAARETYIDESELPRGLDSCDD